MLKIQLGCGSNRLTGWENYDADVDITKPLPWEDGAVDYLFIEHCVEHVGIQDAYRFFLEAKRILKKGGVMRVAVPSVVRIFEKENENYRQFIKRHGWGDGEKGCGVRAITMEHGHQTWYCSEILNSVLESLDFDVTFRRSGESSYEELKNIDSHHSVIGMEFNEIESIVADARKK